MERFLDLLYNDMAMSSLAIQFGVIGVLAAAAGLAWHKFIRAVQVHDPRQLQPVPARR